MADAGDIKNGVCIEFNNDLYVVVEFLHVKPGKGGAFVRSKLKSLTTGKVVENTFLGSAKIVTARIERKKMQFLYNDDEGYHFMDTQTYEQIFLQKELIDAPQFLKEGQEVEIIFHAETEKALACELPPFVVLEVTYAEPGLRGDTATNVSKKAKLETGAEIPVPIFVNIGEKIKVDTRNSSYVERVK
jgi:elongation factor P